MSPKPHFGDWFKRVREKLRISQQQMAKALDLESYITIRNIEKRADRSVRSATMEALLDLLAYPDEAALDAAWHANELPDLGVVRSRLHDAHRLSRPAEAAHFDGALVAQLFRWLASHPESQIKSLVSGVAKQDAAAVARVLVDRVTEKE